MKQISLRLSDGLAEQITQDRGDVPQNTWIVRVIEDALRARQHAASTVYLPASPLRCGPLTPERVEDLARAVLNEVGSSAPNEKRAKVKAIAGLGKGPTAPRPKGSK